MNRVGTLISLLAESLNRTKRIAQQGKAKERDERERFRVTFDSIGDAVIVTDAQGRVTSMNRVAESLTGWKRSEAWRRPLGEIFNVINEQTRKPVENPALRALEHGLVVGLANHSVLIAKDGTERAIDDSAAPIKDDAGHILGVVLVFRDITERRRAEKAQATLAAIVESSEDAIISKDLEGRIVTWNAGSERLFGYRQEEVSGRPITLIIPADRIDEESVILQRIRSGERVEPYETVRLRKDGTQVNISLTVSPVKSPDGEVIGASKIGRDITERKKIEEQLLEADRRKDEFLSMLSHELRNPLGIISTNVQLMRKKTAGDKELEELRDTTNRQVGQMARLLDDLLDVSRIARGQIQLKREPCDLASIVQQAVEDQRRVLEESGLELRLQMQGLPLWVNGDRTRLAQIVDNALNNANKFTDPGGTVTVRLMKAQHREEAVLTVRDTGIGMEVGMLAKAFEQFSQAERSMDRSRGGLGLGLTLVKGLVESHEGRVAIGSEGAGLGVELTIHLPLVKALDKSAKPAEPSLKSERSYRILVIEDNRVAAKSMRIFLGQEGHTVELAYSGPSGLEAARRFHPEVVMCDIGLPGIDGYAVSRALREMPELKDTFLIAITGYGREEDQGRGRDAGFDIHLTKPIDLEQLQNILAQLESGSARDFRLSTI